MQLTFYLEELNNKQVNKQIHKTMTERDMHYEENTARWEVQKRALWVGGQGGSLRMFKLRSES